MESIYSLESKLSNQRNLRVKVKRSKKIFHIHVKKVAPLLIIIVDSKDIKGPTRNRRGLLMIMFTCNVCQHRQGRTFSKDAYEVGVVLIRCEGCENLHLIADNLGWFRDEQVNIESLMSEQGKKVYRFVSKETLEFITSDKMPAESEETVVDQMLRE